MSKELEAFNRFRNNLQWIQENVANLKMYFENEDLHFKEDLDIIETALKDYEELKTQYRKSLAMIDEYSYQSSKNQNKLKALEILKELILRLGNIDELLYETDNDYIFLDIRVSKSTYNLLKEVLL